MCRICIFPPSCQPWLTYNFTNDTVIHMSPVSPAGGRHIKSHRRSKSLRDIRGDCDSMPEMSQDVDSSLRHVAVMSIYFWHCIVCAQTSCLKMLLLMPVLRLREALKNASLLLLIVAGFLDITRNLSQLMFWLKFQTLTSERLKPIKKFHPWIGYCD
jgi:hypothetical protein